MFPFYTLWKHQQTSSFLMFSGGKERNIVLKMRLVQYEIMIINLNSKCYLNSLQKLNESIFLLSPASISE